MLISTVGHTHIFVPYVNMYRAGIV
jgi:hypothetical protein